MLPHRTWLLGRGMGKDASLQHLEEFLASPSRGADSGMGGDACVASYALGRIRQLKTDS